MGQRTSAKQLLRRGFERAQLSVDELARRAGVNRATVYRALSDDEGHAPSTRTIDKLMRALDEELGARAVYMKVTDRDVQFTADWRANPEDGREATQGEMVLYLVEAAVSLLISFIVSTLDLSDDQAKELFDEPPLSGAIVVKLAIGLGLIQSPTAERVQDIIQVGDLVRAAGGAFPLDDETFLSAIDRLSPARTRGDANRPPDPFVTVVGVATILVHELSQRAAHRVETENVRRKSHSS